MADITFRTKFANLRRPGLITCPEAWPGIITPLPDSVVETAVSEGAILSEAEDGEAEGGPGGGVGDEEGVDCVDRGVDEGIVPRGGIDEAGRHGWVLV